MKLRLSSRQSELAQWQAYQVGEALQKAHSGLEIEYLFRESLGDQNQHDPLWKMPEKGVFTKDFYADLISEKTDLIVHSWKDLPTDLGTETKIAATLPRADQRDILLFKKSSVGKRKIQIFTSSPRRIYNLKSFFEWALPWQTESIHFENIRGNIPTRTRKWLADPEADGLVLAKAALDRLLDGNRFPQTKDFLQQTLQQSQWMVFPLQENPNAAAQGALAIEIKSSRQDVALLMDKINCQETFQAVQNEREILKKFGGGCHLALGMSCLTRTYGDIEIVKGVTPAGKAIHIKKMTAYKKVPLGLPRYKLEYAVKRTTLPVIPDVSDLQALYVTKFEAWPERLNYQGLVWTSGNETWKKLARHGVWVNGSNESLGEQEDMRLQNFYVEPLRWGRLSHDQVKPVINEAENKLFFKKEIVTYQLEIDVQTKTLPATEAAYVWSSPQEFGVAVRKFPLLKKQVHICGPGRTYQAVCEQLGSDQNVYVEIFQN